MHHPQSNTLYIINFEHKHICIPVRTCRREIVKYVTHDINMLPTTDFMYSYIALHTYVYIVYMCVKICRIVLRGSSSVIRVYACM